MGEGPHRAEGMPAVVAAPSYSPDMNPIEEAFSKAKNLIRKAKARTLEALFAVTARALEAISEEDARAFFADCGYETPRGDSL
jgi:transposase